MHLPKAVRDEGGVGGGGGGGALYRVENARTGFGPCRAGGQIFPTPLTALIALHFNPDHFNRGDRAIRW